MSYDNNNSEQVFVERDAFLPKSRDYTITLPKLRSCRARSRRGVLL